MQPDTILRIGNSVVQHGPANDRVYLMKLAEEDLPGIARAVDDLGRRKGYSKLFAKVPSSAADHFRSLGFVSEARVPYMYRGKAAGHFMSKYLETERARPANATLIADVLEAAEQKADMPESPAEASQGGVVRLGSDHAEALAELYGTVFDTYPFPVDDPAHIRKAMEDDTAFFGIFSGGRLVAASSAEMDMAWRCAEMTDFATLPECRGRGEATRLLAHMERAMVDMGIGVAYTIARAESYGMNIVFSRAGYTHAGTLQNNTQIAGKLESMNVWFRQLV